MRYLICNEFEIGTYGTTCWWRRIKSTVDKIDYSTKLNFYKKIISNFQALCIQVTLFSKLYVEKNTYTMLSNKLHSEMKRKISEMRVGSLWQTLKESFTLNAGYHADHKNIPIPWKNLREWSEWDELGIRSTLIVNIDNDMFVKEITLCVGMSAILMTDVKLIRTNDYFLNWKFSEVFICINCRVFR